MNITIIVPVYNGAETIRQCLEAILRINYPEDLMEILVVDDGSSDNTLNIVRELNSNRINVISNVENKGRAYTRRRGADEAGNDSLLFIDSRVIVDPNAINAISRNEDRIQIPKTVAGNRNQWDIALNLIRGSVFRNSDRYEYITEENFDSLPKGTTAIFIPKDVFLDACTKIDYTSKFVSEDTGLLLHVVKQGYRIFRNPDFKVTYLQRAGLWNNMVHLFERGPRFVDYYYGRHVKLTAVIRCFVLLSVLSLALFVLCPVCILYALGIFFCLDIAVSAVMGRDMRGRIILLVFLPVIFLSFGLGVLKGLFVKFKR